VDAPIINLLSPEDRMYKADTIELNFTVDEETSWKGYSLDGQANVTIQGNSTLSGLSSIAHNITVFANDSVGNMGSSPTAVFTIGSPQLSIWIILGGIIVAAAVVITAVAIYIRRRKVWNAD
jgi:hypothetical protein